jgi:hypothetical protein
MRVDASDLIELAKANGFESVTEAITIAKKSRAEIERLRAARDEMLGALKAVWYEITLPEKLHRLVVDAIANATRHKGEQP